MSRIRNKYNFFKSVFKLNIFGVLALLLILGVGITIFSLSQEKQFIPEQKKIMLPIVQQ